MQPFTAGAFNGQDHDPDLDDHDNDDHNDYDVDGNFGNNEQCSRLLQVLSMAQ